MKFKGPLKIIRPVNCLFATFTTFLGFWYLMDSSPFSILHFPLPITLACLSTFLIAAGGYAINDFFDFEIDKINKPNRPLPKGEISLKQVKTYSMMLFVTGLIMAFFTRNQYCFVIAIINMLSLYLYAKDFKKTFLFGNFIVAWNACSTFIYGALISSNLRNIMPLVCFSFLYTVIREWVKTMEDFDGDIKENVKSIAVVCGKENTQKLLYIPAMVLIASVSFFYFTGHISTILFFILNAVIAIPLIAFLIVLSRKTDIFTFSKVQNYMKWNMLSIVFIFMTNDMIYRMQQI